MLNYLDNIAFIYNLRMILHSIINTKYALNEILKFLMTELQQCLQLVKTFDNILKFASGKTRRRAYVFNPEKKSLLFILILCDSVSVSGHKYVSIWSLLQQGRG